METKIAKVDNEKVEAPEKIWVTLDGRHWRRPSTEFTKYADEIEYFHHRVTPDTRARAERAVEKIHGAFSDRFTTRGAVMAIDKKIMADIIVEEMEK